MEEWFYNYGMPITGLVLVLIIGFSKTIYNLKLITDACNFSNEFCYNFYDYMNAEGRNQEPYDWMLRNSNRMQDQMGQTGLCAIYRPPYGNYEFRNMQIILNLIPVLRQMIQNGIPREIILDTFHNIDNALKRHQGDLDEKDNSLRSHLRNPVIWFREGIALFTSLPITFLYWFNLIGINKLEAVQRNILFRLLTFLLALISLIGSSMTILLGWEEFLKRLASGEFIDFLRIF